MPRPAEPAEAAEEAPQPSRPLLSGRPSPSSLPGRAGRAVRSGSRAPAGRGRSRAPSAVGPVEPGPEPQPREPAATSSGLTLVDVRRLWPDLLEAVKLKRRYTWILLSQNAQVVDVDDQTLTVALVNAGARNSFTSGGSEEILRQAAIDVIGHDWRVESIVDPSAQPGAEPPLTVVRPAVPGPPATAPRPLRVLAAGPTRPGRRDVRGRTGRAGAADDRSTRRPWPAPAGPSRTPGPPAAAGERGPAVVSDADADRDDPDADDGSLGGAELLERELGASIIEEIKHD